MKVKTHLRNANSPSTGLCCHRQLGLVEAGQPVQTVLFVRKLDPEPVALCWVYANTFPALRFCLALSVCMLIKGEPLHLISVLYFIQMTKFVNRMPRSSSFSFLLRPIRRQTI